MKQFIRYFVASPLLLLLLAACMGTLRAQEKKSVQWELLTPSVSAPAGKIAYVKVKVTVAEHSHMYTTKTYPGAGPHSMEVSAGEKSLLSMGGGVKGSKAPIKKYDSSFPALTEQWEGTVTLSIPVKIARNAQTGKAEGWININFQTCDERSCQPPSDKKFTFSVDVKPPDTTSKSKPDTAATGQREQETADSLQKILEKHRLDSTTTANARKDTVSKPTAAVAPPGAGGTKAKVSGGNDDELTKARKQGFWPFLILCMAAGLGSIFMPCVYPIIPITVSFFTKRNHATHAHAIKDAFFYVLGIILTFTVVGVPATLIFGPQALGDFIQHPIVSISIAALFIALALSLFGLFEIQLPASWVNALNRKANQQGDSVSGVMLMGVVFALTSFSCTGVIVINLLTEASKGDWSWSLVGLTAYATVFALPFLLFALFPTMLKSIPKSGGWMNAIKVVLGFIEIAAAIKYLSSADLIWQKGILTREVVLAIWIAIAFVVGLYLLGRFRMSHDTPVDHIGVPRTLFALTFFSVALWMTTGLFGGKLGELDAILPPQYYPGKGNTSVFASLQVASAASATTSTDPDLMDVKIEQGWITDNLEVGLKVAKKQGKPVFIDFTGYQCTNCRWMELNMFPKPEIKGLMEKFILVRLYTDRSDSISLRNRKLENDRFGTIAMPLYAIVTPDDKVMGTIAFTRDAEEFVAFLKTGLQKQMAAK